MNLLLNLEANPSYKWIEKFSLWSHPSLNRTSWHQLSQSNVHCWFEYVHPRLTWHFFCWQSSYVTVACPSYFSVFHCFSSCTPGEAVVFTYFFSPRSISQTFPSPAKGICVFILDFNWRTIYPGDDSSKINTAKFSKALEHLILISEADT